MSFDSNVILRDVFFRLKKGHRIGLIGKNGTGKTTLLELILGRVEPTDGTVSVDQGLEIGYFSQYSELSGESTVLDVLHEVSAPIHAVEQALREVEIALEREPTGKEMDDLLELTRRSPSTDGNAIGDRKHKRRLANIKKRKGPRPVDKIITGIYSGLSMPDVLCTVEKLSKSYDDQTVLREVSFELRRWVTVSSRRQ